MKKILIVFLILILILGLIAGGVFLYLKNWYSDNLEAVSSKSQGKEIRVEIKKGTGTVEIADILEKNKVIRNADVFKIYIKLNKINNLQAGTYVFNNGKDSVKSVVEKLSKGEVEDTSIKILFVDGKTFKNYEDVIVKNTNNTLEDIENLINNEEYINSLIEKYWFLTDEIKNEDIYYSLEGYLCPDTYTFKSKDVTVEEIFDTLLTYTGKILEEYKSKIEESGYSVHEILTLASIIEKEAADEKYMGEISGIFYNRLDKNMSLGSDVTTYYAFQIDLSESDLTKDQLNSFNPYNTRGPNMNGKLPVGPICNPSKSAIEAAINPTDTDNYYFVSDNSKNMYFTKSNSEHDKLVNQLKSEGKWYTYN